MTTTTTDDAVDRVLELPLVERRSAASRACRQRHDELALYAQLVAERDGTRLDVGRLELADETMRALLLIATA